MNVKAQIKEHIAGQVEAKRDDMQALHKLILKIKPEAKLWFLDGIDGNGKAVANPNIGYGLYTINYADGSTRDFYQVGMSANTTGISVYIMGIKDKTHLVQAYGHMIGKAKVTGYCIHFKSLKDINLDILEEAIRYRFDQNP